MVTTIINKIGTYYMQKLQSLRFCTVLKIFMIIFNTPKWEVLHIICKNSKIWGFAFTAKTAKLDVLRCFKSIHILILRNQRFCLLYAKTSKLEVLHPPQKFQNRRLSAVLKVFIIILNTPKSEVLHNTCINSRIRGFASTAKTPKSEVLCSLKNSYGNI